jgi:hypothetical protein
MTTETYGGYQPPAGATTELGAQGSTAQQAKDRAGNVASTAGDQAKNVAGEARYQARNLMSQTQDQMRVQASEQKTRAAGGIRGVADQLRNVADGNVQGQQQGMVTDLARQASDKAQDLANWLESREPGDLVNDLRDLARRKPGTFLLGAAVAGVLAGRLTRSAVDVKRDDSGQATTDYSSYGATSQTAGSEWAGATAPGTAEGMPTEGVVVEEEIQVISTEPYATTTGRGGTTGGDRL